MFTHTPGQPLLYCITNLHCKAAIYNNSFSEGVSATDVKWDTTNSACTSTERTDCDAKGNSTQFAYWNSICYEAADCKLAGLTWKAGKAAEGGVAAVPAVCASALWVRSSNLFTLIIIGKEQIFYLSVSTNRQVQS